MSGKLYSAGGGTRTRTGLPPSDFESKNARNSLSFHLPNCKGIFSSNQDHYNSGMLEGVRKKINPLKCCQAQKGHNFRYRILNCAITFISCILHSSYHPHVMNTIQHLNLNWRQAYHNNNYISSFFEGISNSLLLSINKQFQLYSNVLDLFLK
jgi:hypothetical protein